MSCARCGSSTPGSSTIILSSPTFCTTGSETPSSSTRERTTVRARSIASSWFGPTFGLVDLEREVHSALQVETPLERDALDCVIDENAVALDPLHYVRGNSDHREASTSAAMIATRYFSDMLVTLLVAHIPVLETGCLGPSSDLARRLGPAPREG
jgi:hypothetical protein